MKTLDQLYQEVMNSDSLKAEFIEAAKTQEGVQEFLKKYGCDADWDTFIAFMKDNSERNLSESELAAAAGGKVGPLAIIGSYVTAGISCTVSAIASAAVDQVSMSECFNLYDDPE